jgi:ATP-dependent RNA helicase DOB1
MQDDRGIVIQMLDEKMEPDVCKDILYGAPNPLNSSYHISYNMLLNLMRVEDVDPEYLLRASFFQFQRELEVPALIEQAEEFEREASAVDVGLDDATIVAEYCKMDDQLAAIRIKMTSIMRLPQHVQRFLQEGRFLRVSLDGTDYGWGVLISHKRRHEKVPNGTGGGMATAKNELILQLDVILCCVDRQLEQKPTGGFNGTRGKDNDDIAAPLTWRGDPRTCRPFVESDDPSVASWRIFSITLDNVDRVSAIKIVIPNDCTRPEARNKVGMMLKEAKRRFQGDFQLLDPVTDLGIKDESFQVLLRRAEALTTALAQHKLSTDFDVENIKRMVKAYRTKTEIEQKAKLLRDEARASQTIAMKEDMRKMKRVLKKLGHVDANGIIQTKGRTACEINTANGTCCVCSLHELYFLTVLPCPTIVIKYRTGCCRAHLYWPFEHVNH